MKNEHFLCCFLRDLTDLIVSSLCCDNPCIPAFIFYRAHSIKGNKPSYLILLSCERVGHKYPQVPGVKVILSKWRDCSAFKRSQSSRRKPCNISFWYLARLVGRPQLIPQCKWVGYGASFLAGGMASKSRANMPPRAVRTDKSIRKLPDFSAMKPAKGGVNMKSMGIIALITATSWTPRPKLFIWRLRYG